MSSEAVGLDPPYPQGCLNKPVGTRVPTTYVLASAYDKMVNWVQHGTLPPTAPRITITSFSPVTPLRNSLGLAQGGIQLSQMQLPTRINSGINVGPGACNRWGYSLPIDNATLAAMYPDRQAYVNAVARIDKMNVLQGYMLLPDLAQDFADSYAANIGH